MIELVGAFVFVSFALGALIASLLIIYLERNIIQHDTYQSGYSDGYQQGQMAEKVGRVAQQADVKDVADEVAGAVNGSDE